MKVYGKLDKNKNYFIDGFLSELRRLAPIVIPIQTIVLVYCIWKIWFKG